MYGFEGVCLSEVQLSISELSVVGGCWWVGGGRDKHTSWSGLVGSDKNLNKAIYDHSRCTKVLPKSWMQ